MNNYEQLCQFSESEPSMNILDERMNGYRLQGPEKICRDHGSQFYVSTIQPCLEKCRK